MAYDLMALLTDDSEVTFKGLVDLVRRRFAHDLDAAVRIESFPLIKDSNHIAVRWGEWALRVFYEDEPHVLEESQELAEIYPDRPDRESIAGCRRRITAAGDDDPDMDYFHGYLALVELLEELPGAILFDPLSGEFINDRSNSDR